MPISDDLDREVLKAIRRLGDRAGVRAVAEAVHRHHTIVRETWMALAGRGLCPPPRTRHGPRPGTPGNMPPVPSAEEIAERAARVRDAWAEADPRLRTRWSVPTGRVCR